MSDYLKSIAGWNLDGSLGLHWMERDMGNGVASVNGFANALSPNQSVTKTRYFRLTFPEPGKILLKVGPGDHSVKVYELTRDDLRGLILDGLPELLGG